MKIEEVFKKLKPISEENLDRLWQEYILADAKTQRNIEDALKIILAKNLDETFEGKEILLEPPPADVAYGEYPLGFVYYGKDRFHLFGLREGELIQHLGIFGRSGSGKTNVGFILILNLLKKGKPFLIFDWKRNYRDLLSLNIDKEILVFTVGRNVTPFHFNPLAPPGTCPHRIWLKKLTEILAHSYFLGEGVSYLMQKALDSVYREFGVYEGSPEIYPTMMDVKNWLENYKTKGRESAWMDSALRAVGVLCFGEVGRVLNQRQSFPIEKLLERNVILELDALTSSDKTFLIESLLLWIHHHRMAEGKRERFRHAIVIEEAHHILMRKKQEMMGEEAITDIILREIRELGASITLLDQHPSLIARTALGNVYLGACLNLRHRSDVKMIADSFLLDSAEAKYLGKLEVGSAIVKLQGRWFEPFLVRFPLLKVEKGSVTDVMVKERMKSFYEHYSEVFREEGEISEREREGKEVFRDFRGAAKRDKEWPKNPAGLAKFEELLLKDIVKEQFSPTSERYTRLGLNSYQGNKAKDSLVSKGIVEVRDMATRTGRIKLFLLTEKGKELAKSLGLNPNVSHRNSGLEREYLKKRLADYYRGKGYRVIEEYPIGQGKTVDLVPNKDGERLAIEIETGESNAVYNIRKDLEAGFDRVICVVLDDNTRNKIQERLASAKWHGKVGVLGSWETQIT